MFIFYKEVSLEDGFKALEDSRAKRNIDGVKISAPSGVELWQHCKDNYKPLTCWTCGVTADRFIVKHHPKDMLKPPVLELFAHTGKSLVMMTRDHIIPASLGGVNDVENLRPGCEKCNNKRKNKMDEEDQKFMDANPHLVKKVENGNG